MKLTQLSGPRRAVRAALATILLLLCVTACSDEPIGRIDGGWAPIHVAAHDGDVDKVRALLDGGEDVNIITMNRWTPLHLAAQEGRVEVARLLLERGANIDAPGWMGYTPLRDAAVQGRKEIGLLLIAAGAKVDLESAAAFGQIDQLKALLEDEARSRSVKKEEQNATGEAHRPVPLHWAAENGEIEAMRLLVEAGVGVDALDVRQETALCVAVKKNQIAAAEFLLAHGANVQGSEEAYSPPLHTAAVQGNVKMVRMLLSAGADADAIDHGGRTALERVRERKRKNEEVVALLEAAATGKAEQDL